MAGDFCDWCKVTFPYRSNKKFCSVLCRNKNSRSNMDSLRRENQKKTRRDWNKLNKDKRDAYRLRRVDYYNHLNSLYQASKRRAAPTWLTEEQKLHISSVYAHARDCGVVSGESYHVDHIIPLRGSTVCGLHVPWNLQVLPSDLNMSKGNR